ncbi:hypothetical protein IW140_002856 [Coemansia sp. RSA 1813]|nr:hypothetical protein EV178_002776 [Coemansia sp. RSA 1646]KAJ1771083.1 hypothetical protein LPJ74_002670 [Coemansia sp. RSA 1843]KAJ2089827.1 hypothetical protein IW138_003121 [Coemansia sp. RSA 986]KAJ2214788.1 hypothetical protein EV179_002736 [Coemansia sp. RSA 487]KAJ2569775.1 hypothetical protein IW140_002856 [Coemansia sp. RSA 1813]
MSIQSALFETPTRTATTRFREKERTEDGSFPRLGVQTSTRSPSQRLKDLFFATYTSGIDPQSSHRSSKSNSYASAALLTPTKSGKGKGGSRDSGAAKNEGSDDDAMDVDQPAAQNTGGDQEMTEETHISEEDLKTPAVPLAISTTGRFYSEHMRRCELRIELLRMRTLGHTPRGIYVMPSLESISVWHGVMFVKRGYWRDAVIRFRIDIPREYPRTHPVITLATPVAHPLVRLEDGRFALEQQFPQWTPYSDHIFHALHYLKNAFKNRVLRQLQSHHCFNIAAYLCFKNNLPQFREHARTDSMKSHMYENMFRQPPDDCPIVFSPISDDVYKETLKRISPTKSLPKQLTDNA